MPRRFVMTMTPPAQSLTKAVPAVPGRQLRASTRGQALFLDRYLLCSVSCRSPPSSSSETSSSSSHHSLPLVTNLEIDQGQHNLANLTIFFSSRSLPFPPLSLLFQEPKPRRYVFRNGPRRIQGKHLCVRGLAPVG